MNARDLLRPRAVLVDMDGTLIDSEPLWEAGERQLAGEIGLTFDLTLRMATIGQPAWVWLPGWIELAGRRASSTEVARLARVLEDRVVEGVELGVRLLPGAQRLLETLAATSVPSALVSASSRRLVDAAMAQFRPNPFHTRVTAEDVRHVKPDPEPYLVAAARLDVAPADCLAVEDSLVGARSAAAAGCRVAWVPTDPKAAAEAGWLVLDSLEVLDLGSLLGEGAA